MYDNNNVQIVSVTPGDNSYYTTTDSVIPGIILERNNLVQQLGNGSGISLQFATGHDFENYKNGNILGEIQTEFTSILDSNSLFFKNS